MLARCRNTGHKAFKYYGERGIAVCEQWQNFTAFREWALTNGYQETLSIDRVDNDGYYTPANCQWITRSANTAKRNRQQAGRPRHRL
jgi:hypothetical protein